MQTRGLPPRNTLQQINRQGFTLIELSILLVIIGLIVGGVLMGRDLIKAAELRSVITEKQNYQTAMQAFRVKYGGLPGDITDATTFWGQASNCGAAGGATLSGGTCNGDGDGVPHDWYIWHHLEQAGLISGNYTGLAGAGHSTDAIAGINVPQTKINKLAGWCARFTFNVHRFTVDYSKSLVLGDTTHSAHLCNVDQGAASDGALTPKEAWNIDTKIDDGMPARGRLIAYPITRCTDAWTDATDYDAVYSTDHATWADQTECDLVFPNAY